MSAIITGQIGAMTEASQHHPTPPFFCEPPIAILRNPALYSMKPILNGTGTVMCQPQVSWKLVE